MNESNLAEVLDEAVEVDTPEQPAKKARKPRGAKHTAEGETPAAEKATRVRKPKMIAQLDEEGNPVLDEEGNPVMVEAPKREPAAPKLDADGNPIPRQPSITSREGAIIRLDMAKITAYKGQRQEHTKLLEDGQTVGDFLHAGGDAGFLRFYVRDGAVTLEG